ncbi:hypothetical protein IAT38_006283 [Cryptococcus sp. DSM 104549]
MPSTAPSPALHPRLSNPSGIHIPTELLTLIISYISPATAQSTFRTLAAVDRRLRSLVTPLIHQTIRIRSADGLIDYIKHPRARNGKLATHLDIRIHMYVLVSNETNYELAAMVQDRQKYQREEEELETLHLTTWENYGIAGLRVAPAYFSNILQLMAPRGGPRHFKWLHGFHSLPFGTTPSWDRDETKQKPVPLELSYMLLEWPRLVSAILPNIPMIRYRAADEMATFTRPRFVSDKFLKYVEIGTRNPATQQAAFMYNPLGDDRQVDIVCCYRDDSSLNQEGGASRRTTSGRLWRFGDKRWHTAEIVRVRRLEEEIVAWREDVREGKMWSVHV